MTGVSLEAAAAGAVADDSAVFSALSVSTRSSSLGDVLLWQPVRLSVARGFATRVDLLDVLHIRDGGFRGRTAATAALVLLILVLSSLLRHCVVPVQSSIGLEQIGSDAMGSSGNRVAR